MWNDLGRPTTVCTEGELEHLEKLTIAESLSLLCTCLAPSLMMGTFEEFLLSSLKISAHVETKRNESMIEILVLVV